MINFSHISVLLKESIEGLNIKENGVYLDGTIGGAGHSYEILKAHPTIKLYGIDQDEDALLTASKKLETFGKRVTLIRGNFRDVKNLLMPYGIFSFDGILLDIGVSSYQIDEKDRGFTFRESVALDMRMDRRQKLTAEEIVNTYSVDELYKIFKEYGEERYSKRIANNIVKARIESRITDSDVLKNLILRSLPPGPENLKIKSVIRIFQALRIEVNDELNVLEESIADMIDLLNPGGRLAIISFHSLEDRIVKNRFRYEELSCICDSKQPICTCNKVQRGKVITRKPIIPTKEEMENNPRSHSAKLRIFEKI